MRTIQALFFLLPLSLFGQKDFAPLNAEWNYEGHEIECQGNHINYVVENEVTIQGNDCSVIYAYTASDLDLNFQKSQDSLIVWEKNDEIYFYQDTAFYLLFDFNNELGDTITYYEPINRSVFSTNLEFDSLAGPNKYQAIVKNIEILSISNMNLRAYEIEHIYPQEFSFLKSTVIENIGSVSQNFTGDQTFYLADGCFGGLQCYTNETIEYKTNEYFETPNPSCDFIDTIDETKHESNILIYPNPTQDLLNIKSDLPIEKIEIITLVGEVIKTSYNKAHIQVEGLNTGIYIINVKSGSSINTIKFLKE